MNFSSSVVLTVLIRFGDVGSISSAFLVSQPIFPSSGTPPQKPPENIPFRKLRFFKTPQVMEVCLVRR